MAAKRLPNIPPFGTFPGTNHKVTLEGILRVLVWICHIIIVGMSTYIYGLAPIMRVKVTHYMAYVCMGMSLQVFPMRLFTDTYNMPMLIWAFATDIIIGVFLLYIGSAVASAIGLVTTLNHAGKLSDHNWNTILTAMILIWVTFFFHCLLLLCMIIVVANKPTKQLEEEEDNSSTGGHSKEALESSLNEYASA